MNQFIFTLSGETALLNFGWLRSDLPGVLDIIELVY